MTDKAGFSATDAALTGFEIARREPLTVLIWSAVQGLTLVPLGFALRAATAPYQAQLQAAGARDPALAAGLMAHVLPFQLGFAVVVLAILAVLYSAVYRTVLRPETTGPGRLRLGRDELRVAGSLVLLALLTFAIAIVGALAAGLVAGLLSAVAPGGRGLMSMLSVLAVLAGVIFVGVRLSLSPVMTFATGRVTVWGSWPLTRGRFWALFGSYLIAGLLGVIIELAVAAVFAAIALPVAGFGAVQALFDPRLQGSPTALLLAFQVVGAVVSGFMTALLAGAPAAAYARLSAGGAVRAPGVAAAAPGSDLPRFGR